MCVQGEQEGNEEVVGVPESFVGLLLYSGMCGGIHQQHAQQHNMSSNTANLRVVNLYGSLRANLRSLNVEEA